MDKRTFVKITLVPGIALVVDQFTKYLVKHYFALGDSVSVLGDFLYLTYIENHGIVFGIRVSFIPLMTVVSVIVTLVLGYYIYTVRAKRFVFLLPFLLIIGGAAGNLVDRIISRGVVDFIDVNIPDISIPSFNLLLFSTPPVELIRWPVFNAADAFITIGMIFLFAVFYFDKDFHYEVEKSSGDNS